MNQNSYIGKELDVFQYATNWKQYWLGRVQDYILGDTLEVGAGLGINSQIILKNCSKITTLTSIEPDTSLCNRIQETIGFASEKMVIKNCFLKDIDSSNKFDTILYIDVIEHIEKDKDEVDTACNYLKKGGRLIILVPAHNFLYSPFDKSIGHFRRYNKSMLKQSVNSLGSPDKMEYLDAMGFLASSINKLILKKGTPTLSQIQFWDKTLIPISKLIDPMTFHSIGKTLIGVWTKK